MSDTSLGRVLGVFVSPVRTFDRITGRPTWAVAATVLALAVIALGIVVHERTDYRQMTERAIAQRNVPEGSVDVERIASMQERFGAVGAVVSGVVVVLVCLLAALLYWVAFRLAGSELSYRQSLAVYVHGALPTALMSVLAAVVLLPREALTYTELTTRNFLASNLAFLAPEDAPLTLQAALAGVDFFALWAAVLMVVGYRISARVSTPVAVAVVAVLWLLGLGVRVGVAALSGAGAG